MEAARKAKEAAMKTYKVTLRVESEHTYEIEANTSEEAESVAEDMYADGEDGAATELSIDVVDSYPVEE